MSTKMTEPQAALRQLLQAEEEAQQRVEQARDEAKRVMKDAKTQADRELQEAQQQAEREGEELVQQARQKRAQDAAQDGSDVRGASDQKGEHYQLGRLEGISEQQREAAVAYLVEWVTGHAK